MRATAHSSVTLPSFCLVTRSIQPEGRHKAADLLDVDGLPHVGAAIWPGQQYYSAVDQLNGGCGLHMTFCGAAFVKHSPPS